MATTQHTAAAGSPSVTLVIGSGSVKCAAAIGVVKVLAEAGIRIERVVGCSGGAGGWGCPQPAVRRNCHQGREGTRRPREVGDGHLVGGA